MRLILLALFASTSAVSACAADRPGRTRDGLIALYSFTAGEGRTVEDQAQRGKPLNLEIADPSRVKWTPEGLEIFGATKLVSPTDEGKWESLRRNNELTVEAWLRPAKISQEGPARIVSLSSDPTHRNFTLGHDKQNFDLRLRTSRTSTNGIPSTATRSRTVTMQLTHLVVTRDRSGKVRWYLNGKQNADAQVDGDLRNWRPMPLVLGNEATGDRPWLGMLSLVAIYDRALSPSEVDRNFASGSHAEPVDLWAEAPERMFRERVAPLLGARCVECHNAANASGKLDLSRNEGLLAGGESGSALEEIKRQLADNQMPQDRPPLSDDEKQLIHEWLDAKAPWSGGVLDHNDYLNTGDGKNWIQRLTVEEYVATVQATVGVDIESAARKLLPQDLNADGFRNTAYNLNVDLDHIEAFANLAELIVEEVNVPQFAKRFGGRGRLDVDDVRKTVAKMGRWVLRGPLNEQETGAFAQIAVSVANNGGTYREAMTLILQAMLQSPRFIYRIENQRGPGDSWHADAYELASRMSYIVWGASPDEELLDLAESGKLYDEQVVHQQLERMLKDPRAVKRSLDFASQWLKLNRLQSLQPDPKHFPKWRAELGADMRRETLAYFEEVCWKQRLPMSALMNAPFTYVTPRLGDHYQLPKSLWDPQAPADKLLRVDLAKTPSRGGLLTHGSVLTVGGDDASMVTRGLFVLQDVLRGSVSDPPPCVDTTPVPTQKGLTQRGIAEGRIANQSCGGCHQRFEPLAFGLERFDGLGSYHEQDEHGNALREDGSLLVPTTAESVAYKTSNELMKLLAGSPRVQECLTWKVAQFSLGRPLVAADVPTLKQLTAQAEQAGGSYADIIAALILSDLVQSTRQETGGR